MGPSDDTGARVLGGTVAASTAVFGVASLALAVNTPPRSGPSCGTACIGYPYTEAAQFVPRGLRLAVPGDRSRAAGCSARRSYPGAFGALAGRRARRPGVCRHRRRANHGTTGYVDMTLRGSHRSGRRHSPPRVPMSRLARRAPWRAWSRGRAKPRHPSSSGTAATRYVRMVTASPVIGTTETDASRSDTATARLHVAAGSVIATTYQRSPTRHRKRGPNSAGRRPCRATREARSRRPDPGPCPR